MKAATVWFASGLLALCLGCTHSSEAHAEGEADCANCPESVMTPGTQHEAAALKKGMTLDTFTPISTILAAPDEFEGQRVLVKGEAVAVCETRGCWINLKSDTDNSKALRVKVEDGEIVFPLTCKGNEVQVEGVWEKMVISTDDYREILRKRADAAGETFDPASVTEPKIVWQLKGLAAKF